MLYYCQKNQLMDMLGYGPLLKNISIMDELIDDLRNSEISKLVVQNDLESGYLTTTYWGFVEIACSSEKTFGLEVRNAVWQEIIRLIDTLDPKDEDQFGTLESRLIESICNLKEVLHFIIKFKLAKSMEEFLTAENYFPNFELSTHKSDFLQVTKCSRCGFRFDLNLDVLTKEETDKEPSVSKNPVKM